MSKFKNWFASREKIQIAAFIILGGFVAWRQIPILLHNFEKEGTQLPVKEYDVINSVTAGERLAFPSTGKNIVIFWATWCAPCKLEMARLKSSVDSGKIADRAIVAVNSYESPEVIRKFLAESPYPFTFIDAPGLAKALDARATPTTVFLEQGQVTSMSTGLSLTGIWRAEDFL